MKSRDGAAETTPSATESVEESANGAAATATTAGLTVIFHSGHVAGRTDVCVPESVSIIDCIIMQ
jgi:hypothetical protein